ncbi:MAG: PAS domain S-box protein [Nitrospiraceae bacterium]|nr:MAG: PAS domain S-box protein [Nitrospiraceae bacterium]
MFSPTVLFFIIFAYLVLLFLIAHFAEKMEKRGSSIVSNPYVYSLSLAVYCTSWTFYGSVGKAANSGLNFLTIYIGPTLMAVLWWVVLRKIVYLCKQNRITTISDFISSRYGNSLFLSALVTCVVVIGITPYLGLQLKAIMTTFSILAGKPEGSHFAGWFITLLLGAFAVFFGARRLDVSERHGGLVFAVAFESAVKLIAFLSVGFFVTYGLFNGFGDIFARIRESPYASLMTIGNNSNVSFTEWTSLTFLSMMAIMFLPRQFHVSVVENSSPDHIRKAMWLFPLYLFLINIFVLPIAYSGLLTGGSADSADYFVLSIPLNQGIPALALFAFLGGFSAATAMVIVESLALSTMVMNSIVMPAVWRLDAVKGFYVMILNTRRIIILGLVFLGYAFAVNIGEFYSLVDIGLKSFEAVTIIAPSFLLGLYWKGGNKKGAAAGIIAGFAVWMYTLMIPALLRAGIISGSGTLGTLFHSSLLNPTALFGLKGLDRWSHSLFWGLLFNILLYVAVSLTTRQSEAEAGQSMIFVDSYSPLQVGISRRPNSLDEIEKTLIDYIGPSEAYHTIQSFMARNNITAQTITGEGLVQLRREAEIILSGALGPSISSLIFRDRTTITPDEKAEISDSVKKISSSLRLSRQELAEKNRQLALLKEFSENIIESVPLGITTLDEDLRVRYWNQAMEKIIGVTKDDALDLQASLLLKCLEINLFSPIVREGETLCKRNIGSNAQIILKVHLSRLTGNQKGYVLLMEDITEKKKIEEDLFRTSKHASIGRLAAGVSHEIGNPLASISSLVQELLSEQLSPFAAESLATVNTHIDRIARIVRNLGNFARLRPREKTLVHLKDILENTTSLVRYDKNFKKIDIRTEIDDIPALKLDPDQIQQVFLNFILNARDAMPEGGRLTISIRRQNGSVEAVFADTGTGIDYEHRDKIFDPFFTTKGPFKGTGLGLSICYSIIRDHGGKIEVESVNGGGSRFIIRLPIAH